MDNFEFYLKRSIYFVEIICAIVASITYRSFKNSPSKIFLPFLWYIVITETIGLFPLINYHYPDSIFIQSLKFIVPDALIKVNAWVYSIYSIVSFCVFLYYYKMLTVKEGYSRYILYLIIIYVLFVIYDHSINYKLFNSNMTMIIIHKIAGVLCTLIASFIYLQTVFKSDEIFTFHKTLPFWITIGLLFFNLVTVPIFLFAFQFKMSQSIYVYILPISSYIMYGSFIVGFIINAVGYNKNKRDILKA